MPFNYEESAASVQFEHCAASISKFASSAKVHQMAIMKRICLFVLLLLEKAVEVVIEALRKNPLPAAGKPAYPNYHRSPSQQ